MEQCLQSVKSAIENIDAEVWVVDNASVDDSVQMVREKFPWVKLMANKNNVGFSKGNNQAIRVSEGEYVLLLNPDTVIEENTLSKVIEFMDTHPECGGLGVHMVDGKGIFLPESKRGLPTPWVSFCKIFGLSSLFPKSERFSRYHLGHLSNHEIHEIEILSGAFMLMRKKTLDEVGLLDEDFFMYGEDIDLSWRIIQGGYKNYYFPETSIIHYKGESTKKGSLNYVFVFYKAMIIFAKKHFSEKNASVFSIFINLAIYLRAFTAIAKRIFDRLWLPVLELTAIFGALMMVKNYYSEIKEKIFDQDLSMIALLIYSAIWVLSMGATGSYKKDSNLLKITKGILVGTGLILICYSLIPENIRFSRAVILFGTGSTFIVVGIIRALVKFLVPSKFADKEQRDKKFLLIGESDEIKRVEGMLEETRTQNIKSISLRINQAGEKEKLNQLDELVRVYSIDEIIFCAKNLTSAEIISSMSRMNEKKVEIRIAPPESMYIIGSNSIDKVDDLLAYDVNSISKESNLKSKRILDLAFAFFAIIFSFVLIWVNKNISGYFKNSFSVLWGTKTWVGYIPQGDLSQLPKIKKGVIHPGIHLNTSFLNADTIEKINLVYAKDYKVKNDLIYLFKNIRCLGTSH